MKIVKAESSIALLISVSVFAILFLTYSRWQSSQNKQENFLFQQQQALQIASNQLALKMAKKPCERSVKQNNLQFEILCDEQQIKVTFPAGEIKLAKP